MKIRDGMISTSSAFIFSLVDQYICLWTISTIRYRELISQYFGTKIKLNKTFLTLSVYELRNWLQIEVSIPSGKFYLKFIRLLYIFGFFLVFSSVSFLKHPSLLNGIKFPGDDLSKQNSYIRTHSIKSVFCRPNAFLIFKI